MAVAFGVLSQITIGDGYATVKLDTEMKELG